MSEPTSADSLDLAAARFARWRERRRAPGGRVPAPLRAIACRLLQTEPLEAVERWRDLPTRSDGLSTHRADDPMPGAFVPLPPPSARVVATAPTDARTRLSPTLTVERPNGLRLHLYDALDAATLALLLDTGAAR